MNFTGKKWYCVNGKIHYVVETVFDREDIAKAIEVANMKLSHINAHSPGGVQRSKDVIKSRIIAGKLADTAVCALLKRQIEKYDIKAKIYEYDDIRSDKFINPDPYDLVLQHYNGREELIEVRSSYCYKLAPENKIIDKLSIYGWYTSRNKQIEPPKEWYWQFVYYLRPADINDYTISSIPIFDEELSKGFIKGYIVGGASRTQLEQFGVTRSDQDGAFYQSISPICNGGHDYFGMFNLMFGTNLNGKNHS